MESKQYHVYILGNHTRTVLYTGITGNLVKRIWQHKQSLRAYALKNNLAEGFTKKYKVHNLVYFESFEDPMNAIEREKQIKNYSRKRKEAMILKFNPNVKDLYPEII